MHAHIFCEREMNFQIIFRKIWTSAEKSGIGNRFAKLGKYYIDRQIIINNSFVSSQRPWTVKAWIKIFSSLWLFPKNVNFYCLKRKFIRVLGEQYCIILLSRALFTLHIIVIEYATSDRVFIRYCYLCTDPLSKWGLPIELLSLVSNTLSESQTRSNGWVGTTWYS